MTAFLVALWIFDAPLPPRRVCVVRDKASQMCLLWMEVDR